MNKTHAFLHGRYHHDELDAECGIAGGHMETPFPYTGSISPFKGKRRKKKSERKQNKAAGDSRLSASVGYTPHVP